MTEGGGRGDRIESGEGGVGREGRETGKTEERRGWQQEEELRNEWTEARSSVSSTPPHSSFTSPPTGELLLSHTLSFWALRLIKRKG